MEGARYVSISLKNDVIKLEPQKNKIAQRTFYNIPKAISEFHISDYKTIDEQIRISSSRCEFI